MTKSQVLRENSRGSAKKNCAGELCCTPAGRWTLVHSKPCRSGARQIARELGGTPVRVAGNKKLLYHAAAAMAAGHVLAVEEAATQLLVSLGMKRSEAVRALLPLTRQVLDNFETLGPRTAWTGPLSRGDFKVVHAHLQALRDSPEEFAEA